MRSCTCRQVPPAAEADDGSRTRDLELGKLALYQLSYVRAGRILDRDERSPTLTPRGNARKTGEMSATEPATFEPLTDQRRLYDIEPGVAYFNTANLSPLLRSVREAGQAAMERRTRPWTITPEAWFADVETLRARFGSLVGASAESVALVPATSYGLAVAARNLEASRGERVIVLDDEFPSDYYTWKRFCERTGAELVVVAREPGETWTDATLRAIDERTAVVAVPNVHWTDGALVDLRAVAERARDAGAALTIDASQSLGAMPLDVAEIKPDALVAVGYKWLHGAVGMGYLYLDERLHGGEPLEENWILRAGSDDFARLVDYTDEYQPGARRFDMGQRSSFNLVPMAVAALDQIIAWQPERIAATLGVLTGRIAARASELGFEAPPEAERGPHMLGLRLADGDGGRTAQALADAGVAASVRGNALRLSPHLHITEEDTERLLAALAAVA
jgi:selenocysteine lyase/cysteine desulfurase